MKEGKAGGQEANSQKPSGRKEERMPGRGEAKSQKMSGRDGENAGKGRSQKPKDEWKGWGECLGGEKPKAKR